MALNTPYRQQSTQQGLPPGFVAIGETLVNFNNITHIQRGVAANTNCIKLYFVGSPGPLFVNEGETGYTELVSWMNTTPALFGNQGNQSNMWGSGNTT